MLKNQTENLIYQHEETRKLCLSRQRKSVFLEWKIIQDGQVGGRKRLVWGPFVIRKLRPKWFCNCSSQEDSEVLYGKWVRKRKGEKFMVRKLSGIKWKCKIQINMKSMLNLNTEPRQTTFAMKEGQILYQLCFFCEEDWTRSLVVYNLQRRWKIKEGRFWYIVSA